MPELVIAGLLLGGIIVCCGTLGVLQVLVNSSPRKSFPRFHSTLELNMHLIDKGYLREE